MKTLSGKLISKIGIGSYGIGGKGHRGMPITEKQEDQVYIDALVYSLQKGFNFTEIALGYGHGKTLSLFKQALDKSKVDRKNIFLTHSLYTRDFKSFGEIIKDINSFYEIVQTDYADSTLVTESLVLKFGENSIYLLLHNLLKSGKTRYVSLSNASPQFIEAFKNEFGDLFTAHEGHLSFELRALQDKGVFELCKNLNVNNIIWRPLRRGQSIISKSPSLEELTNKYGKTKSQIILNWMCHLNYHPMVFSINKKHIDENFVATDFSMTNKDYQRITDFRPLNYNPPEIHWDSLKTDDEIVALVKNFDYAP